MSWADLINPCPTQQYDDFLASDARHSSPIPLEWERTNTNSNICMKVHKVIAKGLYSVDPTGTVEEMEQLMSDLDVHALPVVDEEARAIGIITSSDLEPGLPKDALAADLMSDQVYEIASKADATEAAQMMRDFSINHLVVTDEGKSVGMISSFDLLRVITGEERAESDAVSNTELEPVMNP